MNITANELLREHMFRLGIPEHMHDGLDLYIHRRVPPGSFMMAVLENDLKEAVARADVKNAAALKAYVQFLYNHAPSACWGSPAKVAEWLKAEGQQ